MEYKNISLELKDFSKDKRTALIAHAVYNNIDMVGDISTKGMFNKSWQENKSIEFRFNHQPDLIPGKVIRTFEDDEKAYTEVKFGDWTLGNDVLEMADFGVLKGASFGYITEKKEFAEIKGKKVRKLKEVKHIETSLLTMPPANPLAGIITLNKSEDISNAIIELKNSIETMEKYCRNTTASDESIKQVLREIGEAKSIISKYDTVSTQVATEPDASKKDDDSFKRKLLLFKQKM